MQGTGITMIVFIQFPSRLFDRIHSLLEMFTYIHTHIETFAVVSKNRIRITQNLWFDWVSNIFRSISSIRIRIKDYLSYRLFILVFTSSTFLSRFYTVIVVGVTQSLSSVALIITIITTITVTRRENKKIRDKKSINKICNT